MTTLTIPYSTIIVRFSHNQITYVPANYFKNLTSLNKIFLDHNRIPDINDSAFSQVHSVRHIWINNNQLSVIRGNDVLWGSELVNVTAICKSDT